MTTKACIALGLATMLCVASSPKSALSQETSVGGLFFGDYFAVAQHHDADLEGANGFWARRLYLTFNTRFSDAVDTRARFEAASPGDFTTAGTMQPFIKDLWVRWRNDQHSVVVGLSSSPTWDVPEGIWGLRDLEKTPFDLYKFGSSRDFGLAVKGSFDEAGKVDYHFMVGNGSSTKGETDQGKKFMGSLAFHPTENVTLQVYGDHEDRIGGKDRNTFHVFGAVEGERGRLGLLWGAQSREVPGESDVDLGVFSGFGVLEVSPRVNLVARVDRLLEPVPDGAKISYFRMDPTAKATFFLAGIDIAIDDHFHVIPNIETFVYDKVGGVSPGSDVLLRTTFSVTF